MDCIKIKGKTEYNVVFGNHLELLKKYADRKVFFIIDGKVNVDRVYDEFTCFYSFLLDAFEENKSINTYLDIIGLLDKYAFSKDDLIIAIGGGITLDIAGFVAATFKRGINLVLVPTTLLAMVDASVGSKNALNFKNVKNEIGSFYDPNEVIIDSQFLSTLEKDEYNNGLIEAIKMGLTIDKTILDEKDINKLILKSVRAKASIVNIDYMDSNVRHILNFGHTIGHAIELLNKDFKHGFAIGAGMLFFINDEKLKEYTYNMLKEIYDIDSYIEFIKTNRYQILDAINQDKKIRNNKVSCVFLDSLEKTSIKEIDTEEIDELIRGY